MRKDQQQAQVALGLVFVEEQLSAIDRVILPTIEVWNLSNDKIFTQGFFSAREEIPRRLFVTDKDGHFAGAVELAIVVVDGLDVGIAKGWVVLQDIRHSSS